MTDQFQTNSMNPEEKINYDTFSSKLSLQEYDRVFLKSYEADAINKYFKKEFDILDLGCGAGRTTAVFQQKGFKVIGVDISQELIGLAKKRHPQIDFRIGDASNLNFSADTFDVVFFSFNGLDYIYPAEKRFQTIKEIRRVLKNNGLFIYSSHNAFNVPRTKISIMTFFSNLINLKIFTNYRLERQAMGDLVTYYGNPFKEIRNLEKNGFKFIDIFGVGRMKRSKNKFLLNFLSKHIMYVFKKV